MDPTIISDNCSCLTVITIIHCSWSLGVMQVQLLPFKNYNHLTIQQFFLRTCSEVYVYLTITFTTTQKNMQCHVHLSDKCYQLSSGQGH